MKKIFYTLALIATAGLVGCTQNEMKETSVEPGLFFVLGDNRTSSQTLDFPNSFAFLSPDTWCTVSPVEIKAIGPIADYDRAISLKLQRTEGFDREKAVAVALPADRDIEDTKAWMYHQAQIDGKDLSTPQAIEAATAAGITAHYVAFDHPKLMEWVAEYGNVNVNTVHVVIPANSGYAIFPVMFLKDPSLSTTTSTAPVVSEDTPLKLIVRFEANEHFFAGITNRSGSATYAEAHFTITDMVSMPKNWGNVWGSQNSMFRSWGPRKFEIMRQVTGFTDWEFTKGEVPLDQRNYWLSQCIAWLEDYKIKNDGALPKEPEKDGAAYSGKDVSFTTNY